MTDYLELQMAENEAALLERERRLAAALAGAAGGRREADLPGPAAVRAHMDTGARSPERTEPGDGAVRPGGAARTAADGAAVSAPPRAGTRVERTQDGGLSPWRDVLEAAQGRSVLLEQLERLERAAAVQPETQEGGPPAGGYVLRSPAQGRQAARALEARPLGAGADWMPALPENGGGERFPLPPGAGGQTPSGTPEWAEQVDRVFRRDSRRYDGGFYLY